MKKNFFEVRSLIAVASLILLMIFSSQTSNAQKYDGKYFNNLNSDGVIIDGYDPVAFFTDNKPVKGDAKFQFKYEDAIYYFASQEHLDLFKAIRKNTKFNSVHTSLYNVRVNTGGEFS